MQLYISPVKCQSTMRTHDRLSLLSNLWEWEWGWCKGARIRGKGVETGDFETEVAGGGGVGNAATEGDGGGAANASVLEHLETCRMYWSLRITV